MDTLDHPGLAQSETRQPAPAQVQAATQLLLLGSASGLALHWLVWGRAAGGSGMLLWVILSGVAILWLNRHQSAAWRRELLGWTAVMTTAAVLAVLRDALAVTVMMYLLMLLCVGLVFFRSRGESLLTATIPGLLLAALRLPARILLAIFPAMDTVIRTHWQGSGRLSGVFRGLMLATPLLFVFVVLFASADAVFSQQLERLGEILSGLAPTTPLISLLLIVMASGLLSCSLVQQTGSIHAITGEQPQSLWPGLTLRLGREETAVVMGSLALLFVVFVLLQASYLFGGRELLEARSGLTVAEYARRGFFELLVVAGMTLSVLMAMASVQCHQRMFRLLGSVLIICVLIILFSALYRLSLYIEQFGLTMARLMALALMTWLAGALIGFAATVLRGNVRGFMGGLLYAAIACCLILALINPAARVAEVNIRHAQTRSAALDVGYLSKLGADVVPAVLQSLDEAGTAPSVSCFTVQHGFSQWAMPAADWRDWNAARSAARKAVRELLEAC